MAPHDANDQYNAGLIFPNEGWQAICYVCFALCLTVIGGICARRAELFGNTFRQFRPLHSPWICDLCALGVFVVSYIFVIINGVLTYAVGTNHNNATCDGSVTVCVTIFVVSKVLLYFFMLERLQMIQAGQVPTFMQRFSNKTWLSGAALFSLGVPCAVLLGFSRRFQLVYMEGRQEAVGCHVKLVPGYAIPVIVWCGLINVFFLIAYGLASNKETDHRSLLRKCLLPIVISAVSTCINLSVLLILKGEHGIECLLCCSIDMVANALALAYISGQFGEERYLFGEKLRDPDSPITLLEHKQSYA